MVHSRVALLFALLGLVYLHCLVGANLIEPDDSHPTALVGVPSANKATASNFSATESRNEANLNPRLIFVEDAAKDELKTQVSKPDVPKTLVSNGLKHHGSQMSDIRGHLETGLESEVEDVVPTSPGPDQGRADHEGDQGDNSPAKQGRLRLRERQERFFFVSYTTSTKAALLLTTSSTFYTCVSVTNTAAVCAGRRKRVFFKRLRYERNTNATSSTEPPRHPAGAAELESSMYGAGILSDDNSHGKRLGKTLLTVWSTVSSTKTVTVYATNTVTTVSVSQACTVAGTTLAPACG